ncbi:hypothetical protein [Neisseria polysaccharea]|uniref:hypothetical protein n=1 Tax=Neisseria polysaccharea TaxID=489 RepID=UPI00131B3B34
MAKKRFCHLAGKSRPVPAANAPPALSDGIRMRITLNQAAKSAIIHDYIRRPARFFHKVRTVLAASQNLFKIRQKI